jgi:hypothetical protein
MFHTSVINKGKDNVFGWNNKKKGCVFYITDTICQSSALPLHRETKKLIIITKTFLNNPKAYFRED